MGGGGGGGLLTHIFGFLHFLENCPLESEILGSMDRTGNGKLPCFSGYAQFFYTKLWPSEKSSFRFLTVFSNFCLVSKTSLPNLRFAFIV